MYGRRHQRKRSFKRVVVTLLTFVMLISVCFPGLQARAEGEIQDPSALGEAATEYYNQIQALRADMAGKDVSDPDYQYAFAQLTVLSGKLAVDENLTEDEITYLKSIIESPVPAAQMTETPAGDDTASEDDTSGAEDASSEGGSSTESENTNDNNEESSVTEEETPAQDTEKSTAEEDPVEELFNRLMATTTYDELSEMMDAMTEEEWELAAQFTDEQNAALSAHVDELNGYAVGDLATGTQQTDRYYHVDFQLYAVVTLTVLNADGTTSTKTTIGTVSNPSAKIYNTGSTPWSGSYSTTTDGIKYKSVTFNDEYSYDSSTKAYEYQDSIRRETFYNGDTVELTFTLTYTDSNGVEHSPTLTQTVVVSHEANLCSKATAKGDMHGFDISVTASDIKAAMSTSMLQIAKFWEDNNNTHRPDSITVKVYRTVNSAESLYMTLKLTASGAGASCDMADGVTADSDMNVTFSANYGVSITGLPQNHWVKNGDGTYTYESCSYDVKEVQATGDANVEAVYGSFVYVDDTKEDSYIVTITNTLAYEKLAVLKQWSDLETDDHVGDTVNVKLSAYYNLNGVSTEVPNDWLADFIGGSTTVTLSNDNSWYAVLGYMPVYYTTADAAYPITAFSIKETGITVDNGETYTATYSGISSAKDSQGNYYFTVTNTPQPKTTDITISKTVKGNMGDYSKEFEFTVTLNRDAKFEDASYVITYQDGTSATVTVDKNATSFSFKLKHNESVKISGVPIGASITVAESDTVYTESVKLDDGNAEEVCSKTFTVAEAGNTVAFTNTNEASIDTGISLNSYPFILLLSTVLVGAFVLILGKRRYTQF